MVIKPLKFEHDTSNSFNVITKIIKNAKGQFWDSAL